MLMNDGLDSFNEMKTLDVPNFRKIRCYVLSIDSSNAHAERVFFVEWEMSGQIAETSFLEADEENTTDFVEL